MLTHVSFIRSLPLLLWVGVFCMLPISPLLLVHHLIVCYCKYFFFKSVFYQKVGRKDISEIINPLQERKWSYRWIYKLKKSTVVPFGAYWGRRLNSLGCYYCNWVPHCSRRGRASAKLVEDFKKWSLFPFGCGGRVLDIVPKQRYPQCPVSLQLFFPVCSSQQTSLTTWMVVGKDWFNNRSNFKLNWASWSYTSSLTSLFKGISLDTQILISVSHFVSNLIFHDDVLCDLDPMTSSY